jgi:GNAT superfamily N-acetyltransferase
MDTEVEVLRERLQRAGLGIKDALAVLDIALDVDLAESEGGEHRGLPSIFRDLDQWMDQTVRGAHIERFRPCEGKGPFHVFELYTETGETLGYLNMLYLRKPLPCYYLVYVEVLPPFRGRGLGTLILREFKRFVERKRAVGLLDNIIPPEEPTYDIYRKLGWRSIEEVGISEPPGGVFNYMVYLPRELKRADTSLRLQKLLFNLSKKRPVIDMHDNEAMVRRTIEEFRSTYRILEMLHDQETAASEPSPLIRYLFTRWVVKLMAFRRRIAELLGYTGGESLEQLRISEAVRDLPILPHSLWGDASPCRIWGEEELIRRLPSSLKEEPTRWIERLPFYRRPYLRSWLERRRDPVVEDLRISDLLELGFDPTRLREISLEGEDYVFERISPRFQSLNERKREVLPRLSAGARQRSFCFARLAANPPLVFLRDRGNVYILRRRVEGIHYQEALDQLRSEPALREWNRSVGIDRILQQTIGEVRGWIREDPEGASLDLQGEITYFVPWDLESNRPRLHVDPSGAYFDRIWVA